MLCTRRLTVAFRLNIEHAKHVLQQFNPCSNKPSQSTSMVESVDGAVEGDAGRDLDGLGGWKKRNH
jgi:hypothetical protein